MDLIKFYSERVGEINSLFFRLTTGGFWEAASCQKLRQFKAIEVVLR